MTRDTARNTLGSPCMNEAAYELYKADWLRTHVSTEELLENMRRKEKNTTAYSVP